ncbi:hypothetical protein A6S26_28295 [Nostoc sp. ATCC 43529]|nr:hypothetical protein A6S26_28295 [Nostoc sp. ATCC 43529]
MSTSAQTLPLNRFTPPPSSPLTKGRGGFGFRQNRGGVTRIECTDVRPYESIWSKLKKNAIKQDKA